MEVVPLRSTSEVAALAADVIETVVRTVASPVLGLATGSTPLPAYRELVRRHESGLGPSYDGVRCFNLDEYVGLPAGHPESYRATIARELTDALGIPADRVHGPDPTPEDLPTAGSRYEAALVAAGGVDVQFLGIGTDGHLAFNEPGSSLGSLTRLKTLTDETTTGTAYDTLTIQAVSGGVTTTLATYSNLNKSTGYVLKTLDLSAFKGKTVTLRFLGVEDSSLKTYFFVDDTSVTTS